MSMGVDFEFVLSVFVRVRAYTCACVLKRGGVFVRCAGGRAPVLIIGGSDSRVS